MSAQIEFLLTPFVDARGAPLSGGTVEFYQAGTSTSVDVYAEQALTTNLGPIVTLDSRGTALAFTDGATQLKIIIKDAGNVTLDTFDGLDYSGGTAGLTDYYKRDGSLPLTGDVPCAGYDLDSTGDINVGANKHLDVNHGHGYTPVGGDQILYGGATGYVRQFVASSLAQIYFNTTKVADFIATAFDFHVPLDMNSNKITALDTGVAGTDAVNVTQMTTITDPNTTHRSSAGTDHSDVGLNNTHRSSAGTDHSDVGLNNTHRTGDGSDHSDVGLNNTHRSSDGKGHSDVVLNNTHRTGDGSDHADVATNTSGVAANSLIPYSQGLVSIFAASSASGDGSGKDASNEISYVNLLGDDGLLNSGGFFDVTLDTNTLSVSADVELNVGFVKFRSSAALTISDKWLVQGGAVEFRQIGNENSYNVTWSAGLWVANKAFLSSAADFTINGLYETTVGLKMNLRGSIACDTLFVTHDISMNQLDYIIATTTVTAGGLLVADHSCVEATGAIAVDGNITVTDMSNIQCHSTVTTTSGGNLVIVKSSYMVRTSQTIAGSTTIAALEFCYVAT